MTVPSVSPGAGDMLELVINRVFPAPRQKVFDAFTKPEILAQWWGPQASAAVDLQVGGHYRWGMKLPQGIDIAAVGEFLEIEPPVRLVYTFGWDGEDAPTEVVTMEFREQGPAETVVILTHSGFAAAEARDNHLQGWNDCLDRLVELLNNS